MSEAPINYHAIPMEEMANVGWKFWQAKRKGLDYPINPKFVPWGYYRYTRKDRVSIPLAIWEEGGVKYYRFGTAKFERMGDPQQEEAFAYNTFQHVEKHPISKAEYQHWLSTQEWLDPQGVAAVVEASKPVRAKRAPKVEPEGQSRHDTGFDNGRDHPSTPAVEATIGHNSGDTEPMLTPEDALGRVKVVIEAASTFQSISTQEQADATMALSVRLNELAKEADDRREALKRPHWDAGKAVDEAWNPTVIRPAKEEAARLGRLRGAFAAAETRRRQEAAAAEQRRLDAEALAARATAPAGAVVPPEPRKVVEAAPVVFQAAGGGRKKTAKSYRHAKIVDQDALYEHVKAYPQVLVTLQEIANKVYYIGGSLPGCEEDVITRG